MIYIYIYTASGFLCIRGLLRLTPNYTRKMTSSSGASLCSMKMSTVGVKCDTSSAQRPNKRGSVVASVIT